VRLGRAGLCLGVAIFLAFSRPNDLLARIGALLLAEVAMSGLFFLRPIPGFRAAVHGLPLALRLFVDSPLASPGGALLFALAANFPRPLFRGAWAGRWYGFRKSARWRYGRTTTSISTRFWTRKSIAFRDGWCRSA
jgi:hypothetical protein